MYSVPPVKWLPVLENEHRGFNLQLGEQWLSPLSWGISQPFPVILDSEEFIPRMATSLTAEDTLECLYPYEQWGPAIKVSTAKQLALRPKITLPETQVVFISA